MSTPTTLPIDETTGRPLWRGLPVPWITRWSGEAITRPLHVVRVGVGLVSSSGTSVRNQYMISLTDPTTHPFGVEAGLKASRDEYGLCWYKSRDNAEGVGEPQFSMLNARRQRACMVDRRCQVCGTPFGDKPVTFLDSATLLDEDAAGDTVVTITAPTCRTCAAVALRVCPAQRGKDRVLVTANAYEPCGVLADVYTLSDNGQLCIARKRVKLPLDSPALAMAMVLQMYVEITDFTEETFTG